MQINVPVKSATRKGTEIKKKTQKEELGFKTQSLHLLASWKTTLWYIMTGRENKFNIWFINNSVVACSFSNKCKHIDKIVGNNSPGTAIWTNGLMAHLEKLGRTFWILLSWSNAPGHQNQKSLSTPPLFRYINCGFQCYENVINKETKYAN